MLIRDALYGEMESYKGIFSARKMYHKESGVSQLTDRHHKIDIR